MLNKVDFWAWTISSVDTKKINTNDLNQMYEIERDTWSYFMWEYVKCKNCNIVYWKSDIYSKKDILEWKTVWELEKKYQIKKIKCKCCDWDTDFIRGEELLNILERRLFWTTKSYLNYYRSKYWELLWFSYWFIDNTENTYLKEFSYHFNDKLLDEFYNRFWDTNLLTLSWVCIKEKEKWIRIIYELIKRFYCSIENENQDLISIWETLLNTPSYKIYDNVLPNKFNLNESKDFLIDKSMDIQSDIVYWEKTAKRFQKVEFMDVKQFLKYTKNITKDILVK